MRLTAAFYVASALAWLWLIEGVRPITWGITDAAAVLGVTINVFALAIRFGL